MIHILNPGLTEIRFLGNKRYAIYTEAAEKVAEAIADPRVQGLDAYQLLNPPKADTPESKQVPRDILFHAVRGQLTADADIDYLANLLLDSDVVKPTGAASSEEQRGTARKHSDKIGAAFAAEGWPENPFAASSGNGHHQIHRIHLPNDPDSHFLLSNLLHLAARKFDEPGVTLDKSVSNAARVTRVYGAHNHKAGRDSAVVSLGDGTVVSAEQIRELVNKWRGDLGYKRTLQPRPGGWTPEAIEFFMDFYSIHYRPPTPSVGEGLLWVLTPCPIDESHTGSSPAIYLSKGGHPKYKCLHDSCSPLRRWADFRSRLFHITKKWFPSPGVNFHAK